jgi:protein O-mannosyl-transferase
VAVRAARAAGLAVVLAAATAAYSDHWHNGFHFDDSHSITDNPAVHSLDNLPSFFSDAKTSSVLPSNRTYRPLTTASLALDWAAGRGCPENFQITTFVLYLIGLAALFVLFRGMLGSVTFALAGVAVFGLHPAAADTVNYIVQRADLLAAFGVVAGLAIRARRGGRFGLYLVPPALGMLAKPTALVWPVLLALYLCLFESQEEPRPLRWALRRTLPAALVTGALAILDFAMIPKSWVAGSATPGMYLLMQPYCALRYFGAFILPAHLSADSDLAPFRTVWQPEIWLGFAFVALLAGWAAMLARSHGGRPAAFGLAWFLICMLPVSATPLAELENTHRMFMPFMGLALAAAAMVRDLIRHARQGYYPMQWSPGVACIAGAVLFVLALEGTGTWRRNQVWATEATLWRDVTEQSPHNGRGLMNYGLTEMAAGRLDSALSLFERAHSFTPNYALLEINTGIVLGALGRPAPAWQHFQRAIALAPEDYRCHYYLGRWLLGLSRPASPLAIAELRTAERLNPAWTDSAALLAAATGKQQRDRVHR